MNEYEYCTEEKCQHLENQISIIESAYYTPMSPDEIMSRYPDHILLVKPVININHFEKIRAILIKICSGCSKLRYECLCDVNRINHPEEIKLSGFNFVFVCGQEEHRHNHLDVYKTFRKICDADLEQLSINYRPEWLFFAAFPFVDSGIYPDYIHKMEGIKRSNRHAQFSATLIHTEMAKYHVITMLNNDVDGFAQSTQSDGHILQAISDVKNKLDLEYYKLTRAIRAQKTIKKHWSNWLWKRNVLWNLDHPIGKLNLEINARVMVNTQQGYRSG